MIQEFIQTVGESVCCGLILTLLVLLFWAIWVAFRDGVVRLKCLHQIPCARCQFFTNDYRLKCTVHPLTALSEEAIDCPDYQPTSLTTISAQPQCQRKQACSRPCAIAKRETTASFAATTSTNSFGKFYGNF